MIVRYLSVILIFLLTGALHATGQISYGGEPASFSKLKSAQEAVPVIDMIPVFNDVLMMEEHMIKEPVKSFYFAKSFEVDIDPGKDGVWETVKSTRIWRVAIRSKGAYSLNIIFDKVMIPTGASIFVYTPDGKIVRGAFTSNNEQSSGALPIYPVPGEEIVVEYNEPVDVSVKGILHISSVNHDYKNAFGDRPLGEAGSCNKDVFCAEALPLKEVKQSVVQMIVNGRELCTGTLVNNVREDKSPYLLTAGHCIENVLEAQKTVFCFNYESPFCGTNGSVNGFADQTMTGALLRSRSDYLDFSLVEMENIPPPEFQPYYAGWDISEIAPASTSTVHHPKGDVKKVSIDNDPPGVGSYSETYYLKNAFWWIKRWDFGTTESGSSGGPLFDNNLLVRGTLTGGTATCTNPTDDYFSMISKQWNYYSQSDRQLRYWLDPDNTGSSKLTALHPYESAEACDMFSNQLTGEKYVAQKVSDGRGYLAGTNRLNINEYAEKFAQTKKTYIHSVAVGIAKKYLSNQNSESYAVFTIRAEDGSKGLPGEVLASQQIPVSALQAAKMNLIEFDQPVLVNGNYFATVEMNHLNDGDTLAIYHAADRVNIRQNYAYVNTNDKWLPFYWIPDLAIKTSLLINVHGCENELAEELPPVMNPDGKRFSIYYPSDQGAEYVYLVNAGDEEFGTLTIFDISGRKLSVTQRMFTKSPLMISTGDIPIAGVYLFVVETLNSNEVVKVHLSKN